MTITFKTTDGREIVFTDTQIYEAKKRPASGPFDTEVEVVFFTDEYEKACDLTRLSDLGLDPELNK